MTADPGVIVPALAGGVLIGLTAGGFYLVAGRIAGISGILGEALRQPSTLWRWLFLAGLVLAGLGAQVLGLAVPQDVGAGPWLLMAAGLLVGLGTRLGNGCTSGHGVCGLSRLSRRSLVAVIVFMATAAATVYVARHLLGQP